ncbi:uncharacterized protein [Diabrotica undecimpunctata]|uniref:uncharacterized protein n=1 Tax=Diabrotica undecimpunctata TaxID=50387 RepID=UPI003B634EC1
MGRYEIRLPWLDGHPPLPSNCELSGKRLNSTLQKLKRDGLFERYDDVFADWQAEGIIELVGKLNDVDNSLGHFLPHRPVVKEESTTKARPVFNASAHSKNKPSLNHCLEKDPNLIQLIPLIFVRFRENKIGVISDVKRAFQQIGVHERDCDFLKFLWVDTEGQTVVFRHKRVVFGVNSSPFLLGMTLEYH